jgi:SAM-dependent methyltransferase
MTEPIQHSLTLRAIGRLRALAGALGRPAPAPPPARSPTQFERELVGARHETEEDPVTRRLFSRLNDHDVWEIEIRVSEDWGLAAYHLTERDAATRRFLTLNLGLWLNAPGISEKTGLPALQPPDDVHVMARGPLGAASGLYEADLIAHAIAEAGADIGSMTRALDFGCSSGRVLRVLAAAYQHIDWHGCDPNADAIHWADEHLPGASFFVSSQEPGLPFADCTLDLVYAISIWSHFAADLGLRWFDEMYRVLQPGGLLVCTTHGLSSIAHDAASGLRTPEQSLDIGQALYRAGAWYASEFGEEGDWGVVNPDWGTAFLSPEWMLAQLCPRWRVLGFAPGRVHENQDVYVLQRV